MTYVILIGGIDLSVGSVVALAGVVAGILQVNYGLAHWAESSALPAATAAFSRRGGGGLLAWHAESSTAGSRSPGTGSLRSSSRSE